MACNPFLEFVGGFTGVLLFTEKTLGKVHYIGTFAIP
jgi:hypothetical protein